MRLKTSGDKNEIRMNYLPILAPLLTKSLLNDSGIATVIDLMDSYYLTRDDWDGIMELGYQNLTLNIPTKVKAGFTRTYNKMTHATPFAQDFGAVKKSKGKAEQNFSDDFVNADMEEILIDDTKEEDELEELEEIVVVKPKKLSKKPNNK